MGKTKAELLQGTLDMLILKTVALAPAHGYAILKRIEQISDDALRIEQGSLYPALYRMEQQGWIRAEWGVSETNRNARFYRITAAGRKQLAAETERWEGLSAGVNRILRATEC